MVHPAAEGGVQREEVEGAGDGADAVLLRRQCNDAVWNEYFSELHAQSPRCEYFLCRGNNRFLVFFFDLLSLLLLLLLLLIEENDVLFLNLCLLLLVVIFTL